MKVNPEEHLYYKSPLRILRELCDSLINTTGLVSAQIELALPKQGPDKQSGIIKALELANRGHHALIIMDILLSYLQKDTERLTTALDETDPVT